MSSPPQQIPLDVAIFNVDSFLDKLEKLPIHGTMREITTTLSQLEQIHNEYGEELNQKLKGMYLFFRD
jgi:hypothetical protein